MRPQYLNQDQFAFDAYRVIDTVIMGNKPLWAALEERDRIYEKPERTDEDGMRLGELEGIIGDEDGYTAEPRRLAHCVTYPLPSRVVVEIGKPFCQSIST